jgi:hypothetical protein
MAREVDREAPAELFLERQPAASAARAVQEEQRRPLAAGEQTHRRAANDQLA